MQLHIVLVDKDHAIKSSCDNPPRVPDSTMIFRVVN